MPPEIDARFIISIHAAREGGDFIAILLSVKVKGFQSTPPVKAATRIFGLYGSPTWISIHAAREGGDY